MSDRASREPLSDAERAARDAVLLRLAGRLAHFGGWSIDLPRGDLYWSAELFSMLGFDLAGGTPPLEATYNLYPEQYRDLVKSAVAECMTAGTPMDFEAVVIDRLGRELRVRALGEAVRAEGGSITRIQGAFYDVTEIVTEREERIAAQEGLRTTLDQVPDVVCFVDRSWRMTFANAATIAMTGMSADQLASDTLWSLFPALTTTALRPMYERAMNDRQSGSARDYVPDVDRWLEVTVHPTQSGIAIFAKDVSEDEKRSQQIEEVVSRAREQAALIDASNEAMIMEDLDNVVTYWNQGAEQLYGWTRQEAVGRNIRELIYSDSSIFEEPAAALLRDGRWAGEMVQRAKDGRTLVVECRWQAVLDANGKPQKLFAVNSDVTAQRHERELRTRAQRMESLGTLAGGIAHDLNNVLTPLLMSVQLLKSRPEYASEIPLFEGMELGITRGADMIRQVLTFARGADGEHGVVAVADIVEELRAMSLQVLPKLIDVTTRLDDHPLIEGDRTQVLQVLMNLITNARDAMPTGGTIRITVGTEDVDATAEAVPDVPSGRYAVVAVEDSGSGMTPEVMERIFEPFYTTKEFGQGTGLGLASSMAIVKSHGGALTVESDAGRGSRFAAYFPLASDVERHEPESPRAFAAPQGAGELILVVDDEDSVRDAVRATLEAHGYRTVQASHGRDAIEVFRQHADDVRLVFTDMMMPVMDGAATAAYFFEHHPTVAVVAASGLNAQGGVARASSTGVSHFVAKPFSTDTLLRTIATALHERAVSGRPGSL